LKIGRALTHTEIDDPEVGEPARDEGILGHDGFNPATVLAHSQALRNDYAATRS
jgi:hypothetical protein